MNCSKCKTRITTHKLWIDDYKGIPQVFCGFSCQRGAKPQFESLLRALRR